MISRLSESHSGVTVEICVELSASSFPQTLSNQAREAQTDEAESELLSAVMDRLRNQLTPVLRQVRVLTDASLVEVVLNSYKREMLPNEKS